jgi:hypothetical protein
MGRDLERENREFQERLRRREEDRQRTRAAQQRLRRKLEQLVRPPERPEPLQAPSSQPRPQPLLDPMPNASRVTDPDTPYPWVDPDAPPPITAPGEPSALAWYLQWHHISTNKRKGWKDEFRILFERAGIKTDKTDILNIDENYVFVPGHAGPHDEAYSAYIYLRLLALLDRYPSGSRREENFKRGLKDLGKEILKRPEMLEPGYWGLP